MRAPNIDADKWLEIGLWLHTLQKAGDSAGWDKELRLHKHSSQTLNRLARTAAFVIEHFSADLAAGRIEARSSTMVEFMQLFELDPVLARSKAPEVFADKISVRDLRALRKSMSARTAGASGRAPHYTQRYQAFNAAVTAHLTGGPFKLGSGELVELVPSMVRDTLAPKLHGATSSGVRVAVDIKAPDPMAARTEASTGAALASRIGVLLLKFHQVVVVVPANAEYFARATLGLLADWAMDPDDVLRRSSFLVADLAASEFRQIRGIDFLLSAQV